jgi:hypothetical protein
MFAVVFDGMPGKSVWVRSQDLRLVDTVDGSDASEAASVTAVGQVSMGRSGRHARFKEGQSVEVNYRGKGRYYPAKITACRLNNTYDVCYSDGEVKLEVEAVFIRKPRRNEQPKETGMLLDAASSLRNSAEKNAGAPQQQQEQQQQEQQQQEQEQQQQQQSSAMSSDPPTSTGPLARHPQQQRSSATTQPPTSTGPLIRHLQGGASSRSSSRGSAAGASASAAQEAPPIKSTSPENGIDPSAKLTSSALSAVNGGGSSFPGSVGSMVGSMVGSNSVASGHTTTSTKLGSSASGQGVDPGPLRFKKNEQVEVDYAGKGRYYPAQIIKLNANGTYDILYEDGDKQTSVDPGAIRSGGRAEQVSKELVYEVGDKVEANYKRQGKWYVGTVVTAHADPSLAQVYGTFNIQYDDGDKVSEFC